jgi:hypothetical protein
VLVTTLCCAQISFVPLVWADRRACRGGDGRLVPAGRWPFSRSASHQRRRSGLLSRYRRRRGYGPLRRLLSVQASRCSRLGVPHRRARMSFEALWRRGASVPVGPRPSHLKIEDSTTVCWSGCHGQLDVAAPDWNPSARQSEPRHKFCESRYSSD